MSCTFLRVAQLGTVALMLTFSDPFAEARNYDLESIAPNAGFESGLSGWAYTGAGINANTYLTLAEWSMQTGVSSSPFYSDANLAIYYPGRPWGLNPAIRHIDQSGIANDPTATIGAPAGFNFVGVRQDGYEGHYRRLPTEPASWRNW